MRVITGTARGKKLINPIGSNIRPTSDMVKEAIFNIIQFDIEGKNVLDLFGGTGQMGIETLSRGAKSAVIVDQSKAALKLIRENLKLSGLQGGIAVQANALSYLERPGKFDIIFIDPPYNDPILQKALQKIVKFDKLNDGGIIICEGPAEEEPGELDFPYIKTRSYKYSKVRITLYKREEAKAE